MRGLLAAIDGDEQSSSGLVQLRGVPDGPDGELDGRFWVRTRQLDQRWLALREGAHRVRVRVDGKEPVECGIQIAAGTSQVIRVVPLPRPPA